MIFTTTNNVDGHEITEYIRVIEGENDTYRMVQKLRRKVSKLMDSKYKREPVILPTISQWRERAARGLGKQHR